MSIVSYAQNFEDVLLWRALHDAEPKSYVDIGAQDPTIDSISLAFYQQGWRGTHVEPTPFYAARLREARPDETIIEAAVSLSPGPLEFHEIPGTGLSTGMPEIALQHIEQGFGARTILVPALRLDNLLERTGEVPWMKIDVEGMEADVLASWGDSLIRPWVLVVEATYPNSQEPSDHEWRDLVASRGYQEVFCDGLSRYFVHEAHSDLISRFWLPPNIFDGFQVSENHFSCVVLSREKADQAAELEGQISSLGQRLQASESEREADHLARTNAETRIDQLDVELQWVRQELDAAKEALAAAVGDHRAAIDRLQAERLQTEKQMVGRASEIEGRLSQALAELATLREREGEHLRRADALIVDRRQSEATLRSQLEHITDQLQQTRDDRSRLEGQITDQAQRLETLNRFIRIALDQPVGRWQRLGRAVGIAEEDLTRQLLRSWWAHDPISNSPGVESSMSSASGSGRNPYLRANSLEELLSWQGVDFVRCAYVTVLGRQPDPVGESYYVDRLRNGYSKLQVLWQLRKSPEGPNHDPGIAGLDRALRRARWQRLNPFHVNRTNSANYRIEAPQADLGSINAKLDDINGVLTAKLDQMHVSLRLLEGYVLRAPEIQAETSPLLGLDVFKRKLRLVANKLESEAE